MDGLVKHCSSFGWGRVNFPHCGYNMGNMGLCFGFVLNAVMIIEIFFVIADQC